MKQISISAKFVEIDICFIFKCKMNFRQVKIETIKLYMMNFEWRKKGVENSCLRVFSFLLVQNFLFLLFISQQGCNLVNKWALFFGSPGLQFEDSFNYFYILIEKKINLKHNFFLIFNISVKIFIFSWSYWSVIIYIF